MKFKNLTYTAKNHATKEYINENEKKFHYLNQNAVNTMLKHDEKTIYDVRGDEAFKTFAFLDEKKVDKVEKVVGGKQTRERSNR